MKSSLWILAALATVASASVSLANPITVMPEGAITTQGEGGGGVPCDIEVRYDNGIDPNPGSSPTLGYYAGGGDDRHYFQGVRFTTPAGGSDHEVQSAGWFSDFWVLPGMVDITVYEVANPGNTTSASLNVNSAGDFEVAFDSPLCVPAGEDYVVMLCPRPGVFGVVGSDATAPDARSANNQADCTQDFVATTYDLLLWSCITSCGPVPVQEGSWGELKSTFR